MIESEETPDDDGLHPPPDRVLREWLAERIRAIEPPGLLSVEEVEKVTGLAWDSPQLQRNVLGGLQDKLVDEPPHRYIARSDAGLRVLTEAEAAPHNAAWRFSAPLKQLKRGLRVGESLVASGQLDDMQRRRVEMQAAQTAFLLSSLKRNARRGLPGDATE